MSFPDDPQANLPPDSPRALALTMIEAIKAGHARRDELARQQQEEKLRRIRVIFDTLTGPEGYLFSRITAAIAEDAKSIQIPCGNASAEELAAALRMIPGVLIGPFNTTHATAITVAWSVEQAQTALRIADAPAVQAGPGPNSDGSWENPSWSPNRPD